MSVLERIHLPSDLQDLTNEELNDLSGELRHEIIEVVSRNGGHLASSLGTVELTIALHKVFDFRNDHIFWDVGHQSYAHKLLTGRRESFSTLRKFGGLSGFCRPDESAYDSFISGHAGNAVSAAMGFSVAAHLDERSSHVVAVVGDGALINGITLEALNNLSTTCRRMIIILNDNKMSIGKNIGAIPRYLNNLITGREYNRFKVGVKHFLNRLPGGSFLVKRIGHFEKILKSFFVPGILFEEMGIRYVGPINGHDIAGMIQTLDRIRDFNRPVLVHVITEKGHGCEYAVESPERFHGIGSFNPENGELNGDTKRITFSSVFGRKLEALAEHDNRVVAITAAMASGCGITESFCTRFPERYFDVGIAEEHAVTFAGGLAAAGKRPIVVLYGTFLQRALDCVFHDVCLQKLPVLFCIDRAGAVEDGPTHHGIYDLSFLTAMPDLAILQPESGAALEQMMELALQQNHPVAIRYPRGAADMPDGDELVPVEWGKAVCDRSGTDLAIWASGRELYSARETADILLRDYGLSAAVYNVRFLKPFDREKFLACAAVMPVVTLEDHVTRGGLASIADECLVSNPHHGCFHFGWNPDIVPSHGSVSELKKIQGIMPAQIASVLAEKLKKS